MINKEGIARRKVLSQKKKEERNEEIIKEMRKMELVKEGNDGIKEKAKKRGIIQYRRKEGRNEGRDKEWKEEKIKKGGGSRGEIKNGRENTEKARMFQCGKKQGMEK